MHNHFTSYAIALHASLIAVVTLLGACDETEAVDPIADVTDAASLDREVVGAAAEPLPPAWCRDGQLGSQESDVDCGGACGDCALGRSCRDAADCASGLCRDAVCTCPEGFVEDEVAGGGRCRDVDECAEGLATCDPHATCTNSSGGYGCRCAPGWVGDGQRCAMSLDCLDGMARCAPQAACVSLEGGHFCVCGEGFRGDGFTCEDVDECLTGQHDCHDEAHCIDMPGRYRCITPR